MIKITGCSKSSNEYDECPELSDIGIFADAATLRELATFFNAAADEMDDMGDAYDHVHLMDKWKNWNDGFPDIQVISTKYIK